MDATFAVARDALARLGLDRPPTFTSVAGARRSAARLTSMTRAVEAGDLLAIGLIDAVLRRVAGLYRERLDPSAFEGALAALDRSLGRPAVDAVLDAFAAGYLPAPDGRAERLEAVLHVWLCNANPAFAPVHELIDDRTLANTTAYERLIGALGAYFADRPPFGPEPLPLVALLRSPAVAVPDSLAGQIEYIREQWAALLGDLLDQLVLGLDVLDEEARARWLRFHPGETAAGAGLSGGALAAALGGLEGEPERFSADRDWMPRLVLIAKSTYVWLDQLSRRHGREIRTLDAIPDEELDMLAHWGISGLWLIGIWQRSRASERIKRRRGNPEAVASAYSLDDYRIADDLGGEDAFRGLRQRAWNRGIRLASDMVPNHMGIDSRWVIEHPERFLSLPEPPYPAYSFSGPDLSDDPRVGIFLEDHYWDASDAAVVFRRLDRWTGDVRYTYHGNDGTSFPWNDTAQLDYLRADVREAVIEAILDVARRFPIIRFDAAMTLARRHIRRLWYPEPGAGGSIPSRAEHALSAAAFDAAMPAEFWREVVDRVAAEIPDTLLLAEAFWLMEGYFVRTLGMHRVYNSAFMHMLRDERNAEYRLVLRQTLEFDPEILKRYVNFMNNPDEKTAVEQFGKGDKYFGVATLLATLPGLPMFGHGQVEGFAEKYGMEYRRAYHDEEPDGWLVDRHERELFPLLHRRAQFAEVRDFLLYDFVTDTGVVNEDVFAYSNGTGPDRSLVVYHNRFASTAGSIRESVGYSIADPAADGGRRLVRRTLGDGLALPDDPGALVAFRDQVGGLEYLRWAGELRGHGLHVALDAYRRHVFLDFREVRDGVGGGWGRLAERLAGRGTPNLEGALREMELEPVREAFGRIVHPDVVRRLFAGELSVEAAASEARRLARAAAVLGASVTADELADSVAVGARALAHLGTAREPAVIREPATWAIALGFIAVRLFGRERFDDWLLAPALEATLRELGLPAGAAESAVDGVRAGLDLPRWPERPIAARAAAVVVLAGWLRDDAARRAIGVHEWDGVEWVDGPAWERFTDWQLALEALRIAEAPGASAAALARAARIAAELRRAAPATGYRVAALRSFGAAPRTPRSAPPRPVRRRGRGNRAG